MRILRTVTTVVVAGVVFCGVGFASGANALTGRQAGLQLNMCGNVCNHGGLAVVANIARTIAARAPLAVTLNEVCQNQYDRLRADLAVYSGRFDPTGPLCTNGARYGNAILVRTPQTRLVGSWPLPDSAG